MNNLRLAIFRSLRGYHRRSGGARKATSKVTERELYPDVREHDEPNEDDFDDVEQNESDFMEAHQVYNEHKREEFLQKQKLKTRIIARKYFKPEDPSFLTWTEKIEIQSLHDRDPVEFSPDRLSESFPALPDAIRRVLRARWRPKSEHTVQNYDQKVIDNWRKFNSGNLAVSSRLETHLQKFKFRKVEGADVETISKKFLREKPVFPAPRSTLFSSVVENFGESPKGAPLPEITDGNPTPEVDFSRLKIGQKPVNFDTFMEKTVKKISNTGNLSSEVKLLVDKYRNKRNEAIFGDFPRNSGVDVKKRDVVEDDRSKDENGKNEAIFNDFSSVNSDIDVEKIVEIAEDELPVDDRSRNEPIVNDFSSIDPEIRQKKGPENWEKFAGIVNSNEKIGGEISGRKMDVKSELCEKIDVKSELSEKIEEKNLVKKQIKVSVPKLDIGNDSLATGILEWTKTAVSAADDYPRFIKIPRNKAQSQITFRVEDRYYDCDGEFLYRVPGLKSA